MTLIYAWLAVLTVACVVMLTAVLQRIMKPLAISEIKKRAIVMGVPLVALAWLMVTGSVAWSGILAVWDARPPRLPVIPFVALLTVVILHRTAFIRALLAVTPRHWPVAMQSFRIGVELSFWGLFALGGAPVQVTFEGRNFDVVVGATAPFVALAIARLKLSAKAVIAWNVLGLGILLNTIITTFTSTPGPLHLNWPGQPFTAFATWPFIWIPAFLAPLAIFLHVFSIRQNLRTLKS